MKIWKYILSIEDSQIISMPFGAKILSVQVQKEQACMWVLVNPDNPERNRQIEIRETGQSSPTIVSSLFIGTFQLMNGSFVGHVFDKGYITTNNF